MWNKIKQFNDWYDQIAEPWRFLIVMVPASIAVGLMYTPYPTIGLIILLLMIIWVGTRFAQQLLRL